VLGQLVSVDGLKQLLSPVACNQTVIRVWHNMEGALHSRPRMTTLRWVSSLKNGLTTFQIIGNIRFAEMDNWTLNNQGNTAVFAQIR
jgi:hypothetical protein